ncbi:MAG: hypothetical protein KDA69_03530 [Planctomycetaceae bacterium]|nr:hypothetical protein [Planctomycetaceae bacterium]MCA9029912.1 hypothetical protein [Planctomycetaceae bacterium]MCA9043363.1 hypothetical protein [Planctomycetaceae bacterium]MCB9953006.1 hypothetical protein [Planctomycetaceae bacterium]
MSLLLLSSVPAYIGPGAGLGFIGALISLVVSIGFSLFMVVVWPIRAAFRKAKAAKQSAPAAEEASAEQPQ